MDDYLLIGGVQVLLLCGTAFFFYKQKRLTQCFPEYVKVPSTVPSLSKLKYIFGLALKARSRAASTSLISTQTNPTSTTSTIIEDPSSSPPSSPPTPPPTPLEYFPALSRQLSTISTDSGASDETEKKSEEYLIEFLDLLQAQPGQSLTVRRKLAVKLLEMVLNSEAEPVEASYGSTERAPSTHERLDLVLEELSQVTERLRNIECTLENLDVNNNNQNNNRVCKEEEG